ncbi:nitroreductase [Variovorax sp. Root411]|uniref:nitroreductase n=1 Tax=Variovorax sp. Root411 TaxID=1736530 RepID=UPI0006FC2BA5|nr:nitroreductase [Variovorax sp. Root411]KQW56380.1 nitrobenzoate reductase [Variovorax sp. Root411]
MLSTLESIATVDAAITSRRAVRAFLPTQVPRKTVEDILEVASRAPSGTNVQPWKVYVLGGEAKTDLSRKILEVYNNPTALAQHRGEFDSHPTEWVSPYIDRRRKVGWDMYGILGIGKGEDEKMHAQRGRNYEFFDAPVALMFTIDRVMSHGSSWLDYGTFLQNVMVAARARGLHTCPQGAFQRFHRIVLEHIDAPPGEALICGMALGYEDASASVNSLLTERAPVSAFAKFINLNE